MHEEKNVKSKETGKVPDSAIPAYLLDREQQARAKVLSNTIKQKRKEKAVGVFSTNISLYKGDFFRPMHSCNYFNKKN